MIAILLALATPQPIRCEVVAVHDGDTMRCSDGASIRLQGIDANELDGSCHTTCAILTARDARDNLAQLALGRRVSCEQTGTSCRRVTAWCSVGGVDLSCAQVHAGAAVRWAQYDRQGRLLRCERVTADDMVREQMGVGRRPDRRRRE
jgi:endonuclease YncB( thermonuclease family)